MKKENLLILAIMPIILASCGSKSNSDVAAEFWETDNSFEAPADWVTYSYADAFSIKVPGYMKERLFESVINEQKLMNGDENYVSAQMNTLCNKPLNIGESAEMTFSARNDSIHNNYARIYIQYMKANNGDFLDYMDLADLDREDSKTFCDLLLKNQLGTGTLIKVRRREMFMTNKCNMALDICYQRVGHTENEGPVTVHIYYLQHTDEAVLMTISYHDKNKVQFKDLFNIVQTLEWNHYKSKRSSYNY